MIRCPACGHTRRADDPGPGWQCARCLKPYKRSAKEVRHMAVSARTGTVRLRHRIQMRLCFALLALLIAVELAAGFAGWWLFAPFWPFALGAAAIVWLAVGAIGIRKPWHFWPWVSAASLGLAIGSVSKHFEITFLAISCLVAAVAMLPLIVYWLFDTTSPRSPRLVYRHTATGMTMGICCALTAQLLFDISPLEVLLASLIHGVTCGWVLFRLYRALRFTGVRDANVLFPAVSLDWQTPRVWPRLWSRDRMPEIATEKSNLLVDYVGSEHYDDDDYYSEEGLEELQYGVQVKSRQPKSQPVTDVPPIRRPGEWFF